MFDGELVLSPFDLTWRLLYFRTVESPNQIAHPQPVMAIYMTGDSPALGLKVSEGASPA